MGRKRKGNPVPLLPPEIGEDEIDVSDEDYEFLKENRDYAGFLKKLDTKSITRHVARLGDDEKNDDLEKLYEKRRKPATLPEEKAAHSFEPVDVLPVKTLEGKLCYGTELEEPVVPQSAEDPDPVQQTRVEEATKKKPTKAERRKQLKEHKKQAKRQPKEDKKIITMQESSTSAALESLRKDLSAEEIFEKKKNRLAELGMSLIVDPDQNIAFLKELVEFCGDDDKNIVKLGLLSLFAVFKDIIPGYRIRLPTEKELQMVVSKEVKQMRYRESTLLHFYKVYLQKLIVLEKKPFFQHVVVRCLCGLLEAHPHFNLRESLLGIVIERTNSPDSIIRKLCCDAVKSIFLNEGKHGGDATVEAVELISDLVKSHDCQLHPDCIEVFLSLSFDEDLAKPEPVKKDDQTRGKRRERERRMKEQKKASAKTNMMQEMHSSTQVQADVDFKPVSFSVDPSDRRIMQTRTLSAVFGTYFRILKDIMASVVPGSNPRIKTSDAASSQPALLIPCLRGLGNFSHLISIDFLGDLLSCLKKIAIGDGVHTDMHPESNLTVAERLQCCIVAFKIMRSNMDALNVDLHDFFVQLYNLLMEYTPDRANLGTLFAESFKIVLCDGRQHDMHRAAAFIKRLTTFSLCFGSAEAMTAMVTSRHLLQKNNKCQSMLENDEGGGSLAGPIGKYHPDASDPNLSGALSSVLWELSLLSKHFHPAVSAMASSICRMNVNNSQVYLPTLSPQQAFTNYTIESEKFSVPTGLPKTIRNRKKRTASSSLFAIDADAQEKVKDDQLIKSFSDHFTTMKEINENERLRRELNRTVSSLNLYKTFKGQRKKKH